MPLDAIIPTLPACRLDHGVFRARRDVATDAVLPSEGVRGRRVSEASDVDGCGDRDPIVLARIGRHDVRPDFGWARLGDVTEFVSAGRYDGRGRHVNEQAPSGSLLDAFG